MSSIRRQLLALLLGVLALTGVVAGCATYWQARDEVNELFDYQLRQMALSLRHQVFLPPTTDPAGGDEEAEETDFILLIGDRQGRLLNTSDRHFLTLFPAHPGLADATHDGNPYKVYTQIDAGRILQVAQPLAARVGMAREIASRMLDPMLEALPVLALLIWLAVGHGLRSITAVTAAIHARSPDSLEPMPLDAQPRELQPMTSALNDLMARLDRALTAQRALIADAAHELRTPLAVLQLQAQMVERAQDDAGRHAAIEQQKAGIRRATRLVEQLLTLSRLEPGAADRPQAPVALDDLARRVVAIHAPLAAVRKIDLGVIAVAAAIVPGNADDLTVLLGNLVDNAVRYTPEGGRIDVRVGDGPQGAWLEVADNGTGIPAEERERVFDRFYRRLGTDVPGSGLGLAIVRNIAEAHGAVVTLDDSEPPPGLKVTVRFPPAAPIA